MRPRSEQAALTLILRDLEAGPATIHDLAAVTGLAKRNIRHYLKLLRDLESIYISDWERRTGPALPVWSLGAEEDKRRPRRQPRRKYKRRSKNGPPKNQERYT